MSKRTIHRRLDPDIIHLVMDSGTGAGAATSIEVLQTKTSPTRKPRPPNLLLSPPIDSRLAVPGGKMNRRESRLGLRSIFGRSKAIVQEDLAGLGNLASPITAAKFADIRPSVTARGAQRYNATPANIDTVISTEPLEPPTLPSLEERPGSSTSALSRPKSNGATKPRKQGKAFSVDAPPLFKAFPQAVRYATLPAAVQSPEVILRMNEKKPESPSSPTVMTHDEDDKKKKKHRKTPSTSAHRLEWTTKVYVLAASGRLFQYTGDGPFDRLPERSLILNKDSAAFASDIIPGKHWVLQVMSSPDIDSPASPESRSLFSRFWFSK